MKWIMVLLVAIATMIIAGCDKDDSMTPNVSSSTIKVTIENVAMEKEFESSGVFNTPVGGTMPAPIGPGEAYEFTFKATPGSKLSFATMMVQSNDFFYAPGENGIELFTGSTPNSGDITDQIMLWDAGTEVNQEPGLGEDQAPRQQGPNTGAVDGDNTVRLAPDTYSNLPMVTDVLQVTLTSLSDHEFKVKIENKSTENTLMTSDNNSTAVPLAPGVFVVHKNNNPLFVPGAMTPDNGLEALAEDGDPTPLFNVLQPKTGITHILAPGVFAVTTGSNVLFESGMTDKGEGLEALAEDGDPSGLASAVQNKTGVSQSGIFDTPVGSGAAGPALPGTAYEFTVEVEEGDRLFFATMMVQSNDLFFAPDGNGIELFTNGTLVTGDITNEIMLWDAGTEVNEEPGFGPNQAPRQSGPNTGIDESGTVDLVNDGFQYPAVNSVIKVTITQQ